MTKRTAVLWTGGKDSCLALDEAVRAGYGVAELVTFAPAGGRFRAHPIAFLERQAEALGLPHRVVPIEEPFRAGYEEAIRALRAADGIEVLVTGDIAEVDGQRNWIRERSRGLGVEVVTPLWGRDRDELLDLLLDRGFRAIFSLVKEPWFTPQWAGRELDRSAVASLRDLRTRTGLDLCGEQGEYHTLVLDGPPFAQAVEIGAFSCRTDGPLAYVEIAELRLAHKPRGARPHGTSRPMA
jgi:uncharacterized protein (TIGR00290 family)